MLHNVKQSQDSSSELRLRRKDLGIFDKQGTGVFIKVNALCIKHLAALP